MPDTFDTLKEKDVFLRIIKRQLYEYEMKIYNMQVQFSEALKQRDKAATKQATLMAKLHQEIINKFTISNVSIVERKEDLEKNDKNGRLSIHIANLVMYGEQDRLKLFGVQWAAGLSQQLIADVKELVSPEIFKQVQEIILTRKSDTSCWCCGDT